MPRRQPRRTLATRWSRRWRCLRLSWQATSKSSLIVVPLLAGVVAAFAWALHSVHTARVDWQSLRCLALNVYYEARGEPEAGQYAVAEVTMNRVSSGDYPATVCRVVYQQNWDSRRKRMVGAFSWTELDQLPEPKGEKWARALEIAQEVYYQRHEPLQLANAMHYHADYIRPRWSRDMTPVARIGNHIFYR